MESGKTCRPGRRGKVAAYYNEIDPFAAHWLRNLMAAGHIADGDVDERSIVDVQASDLEGFSQVHLFAGIGAWSYSLRLAGVDDTFPVWTGSCPCQPFSDAGKGKGLDDERHLWPSFFKLVGERRPPIVFGEQVASKAGLEWLDVVSTDLETAGYAVGAADLAAASVGAPHKRQRLFWVGHADDKGSVWDAGAVPKTQSQGDSGGEVAGSHFDRSVPPGEDGGMGKPDGERLEEQRLHVRKRGPFEGLPKTPGASEGGLWSSPEWVLCRDPNGPRWRPTEPGAFPLADGAPARLGRLRGYGNAIVAPLAAEFIRAALDAMP